MSSASAPRAEDDLRFRIAVADDWPAIWPIFHAVVAAGDSYAYSPEINEREAESIWMLDGTDRGITFVAE